MRKILGTVVVLAVEGFGSKVVEMTIFPKLLEEPYIFYVFALLVVSAVAIWWPEIRRMISPTDRIVRRGEEQLGQKRRSRVRRVVSDMKKNPWLGNIKVIDYEKALVEAVGRPPRTWRYRLRKVAVWTANRSWWVEWQLTERVLFWVLKKMPAKEPLRQQATRKGLSPCR